MNSPSATSVKRRPPLPKFYDVNEELTFSTKKERHRSPRYQPSRPPPAKTTSSLSRVYPHVGGQECRTQFISFKPHSQSYTDIFFGHSPYCDDSSRQESYFDQGFDLEGKIGEGSFGEVFRARSKEDGKLYAVKRGMAKFRGWGDRAGKLREVQKHEQLPKHPNIVEFVRAWEERGRLYIQTELCCCSLLEFGERNHNIPESQIWAYLVDLLLAVRHLHEHHLLHMDIKADNIFISRDGLCKLGDFGLVYDWAQEKDTDPQEGDSKYIAPELLHTSPTTAADIFSLGLTILELATDIILPTRGENWQRLRQGYLPLDLMTNLSPKLVGIIRMMTHPNPKIRPSAAALLQNPVVFQHRIRRQTTRAFNWLTSKVSQLLLLVCLLLQTLFLFVTAPLRKMWANRANKAAQTCFLPRSTPPSHQRLAMPLSFQADSDDDPDELEESLAEAWNKEWSETAMRLDHEDTSSSSGPDDADIFSSPKSSTPSLSSPLPRGRKFTPDSQGVFQSFSPMNGYGDGCWAPDTSPRRPFFSPISPAGDVASSMPQNLRLTFDHHGSSSEDEL